MVKMLPVNAGDAVSIPGLERSPGVGNGNPPQYSCLENAMDRGAWQATVHAGEVDMHWSNWKLLGDGPSIALVRVLYTLVPA